MRKRNQEIVAGILFLLIGCGACSSTSDNQKEWKTNFASPPNKYRPQPFWHINGELTKEGIYEQITDAYRKDGFGGVAILPLTPAQMWGGTGICPGTTPEYLSDGYFDRYRDILECSHELGTEVILYDDVDFPSGVMGGKLTKEYPQYTQKRLSKQEKDISGPMVVNMKVPVKDLFMGAVAMNMETLERIDLTDDVHNGQLQWNAPSGKWKIMSFYLEYNVDSRLDYMDPEAIDHFISMTYEQYATRFRDYFGNTVRRTFFDDVGYLGNSRFWNQALTRNFEKRYNKKAVLYYPALWYHIGEETEATRVAFYGLRAEMVGEGYPKKVAEWSTQHGLLSMGHPPGNYEPTTVDMYGDPFKYYRHTPVPLMDAIHGYPYGRPGFKLISSAADVHDRPNVAVEIYGNYIAKMDSFMLYRGAMEVMVRGVNFLVPHGMWYNPDIVKIPPLIAHYSKLLGPALHHYSDYVGRSVSLLEGGNRVADIALLYPIESLEAWYELDNPNRPTIGKDVPPYTDYNRIGDMLTGQIRQDFTFVHPEELQKDKYRIQDGKIFLDTKQTHQAYKLLIMPAAKVLSVETLKKIQAYYNAGGKILATHLLPSKSSEFGRDEEVVTIIRQIFNIDPMGNMPQESTSTRNDKGGEAIFLPLAEKDALAEAIAALLPDPDVKIDAVEALNQPDALTRPLLGVNEYRNLPSEKLGQLSYIHKQKDGKDIYLFANSTDKAVNTWVTLKGDLKLECWNPHTGAIEKWENVEYLKDKQGETYTKINLQLAPVSSIFAVSQ